MREPRASDVGRWRTELTSFEIALIEMVAGGVMDSVGQRRRFRGLGRIVTTGVATTFTLAEWSLPLRRRLGIHFPGLQRRL
jgi:hypothetical protein